MAQTFQGFVVIIVNDGSTDGSKESVERFIGKLGDREGERLRILDQENQGVAAARNRGIEETEAELVAFLDADDEWMPQFLESIMRLRQNFPECDVFATNYVMKKSKDVVLETRLRGLPEGSWEGVLENYFRVAAKSDPPLCSSAVAVTKRAIKAVRGFPIGITSGEDLLTWARLAAQFQIAYSAAPQAIFWRPIGVSTKPRMPQNPDIVGVGLAALLSTTTDWRARDLRRYIGLWHRMRANSYLRLAKHATAQKELWMSLSYDGRAWKTYAHFVASHAPWILSFRRSMRRCWVASGSVTRPR